MKVREFFRKYADEIERITTRYERYGIDGAWIKYLVDNPEDTDIDLDIDAKFTCLKWWLAEKYPEAGADDMLSLDEVCHMLKITKADLEAEFALAGITPITISAEIRFEEDSE